MTELAEWATETESLATELKAGSFLAVEDTDGRTLAEDVRRGGYLGVLPLWKARDVIVGLLALPQVTSQSWPGVLLRNDECFTIASDRTTLLPQVLVRSVLRFPDHASRLAEGWDQIEPRLHALHTHLGGDVVAIEVLADALRSDDVRAKLADRGRERQQFERAASSLFRAIDRSEPARQYADWLDAVGAGQEVLLQAADLYGVWSRRVLCWSDVLDFAGRGTGHAPTPWRYRIIEEGAGVDCGLPIRASWHVDVGDGSPETVLLEVAMQIDQDASLEDPVTKAMARAMYAEGPYYRGMAHAEAVVVLKDQGQLERAWGALQSASWWSGRNMGDVPEVLVRGARLLAQEQGWVEILAVIEFGRGAGK